MTRGDSLFGDDGGRTYEVLARKYRPRRFEDLIGQEAMVRTLANAFETGRIAHAYMLTGLRGIGKTTTARLLARALNYQPAGEEAAPTGRRKAAATSPETSPSRQRPAPRLAEPGPSIHLDPPGVHCEAIMASRHPDVLELDAASRTGVADMRELLDSARYGPVSARYKVYIIDEVHMLSTASFNALLKTLEEPPPHLKFIFATTEIRKVPVTVLSRCQRFELKRLDTDRLADHLGRIAAIEGARIDDEALALIARAAEGSVRDGLSLLDQAIVQTTDGSAITAAAVRDMLGLGDRTRLYDLMDAALRSDGPAALAEARAQVDGGAEPVAVLKDLLEIAADVAVAQVSGEDWRLSGPAEWTTRTRALARHLTPAQAARTWQLLLAGFGDLQLAPDPETALNMVILRLAAASGLPSPEEAARRLLEKAVLPGKSEVSAEAPQTIPGGGLTFAGILSALGEAREVSLQIDVERFVRPARLEPFRLACALAPGAPADLLGRLRSFLERWTGEAWDVAETASDTESIRERERRERAERIAEAARHPLIAAALAEVPGLEIVDVTLPDAESAGRLEKLPAADNVIAMTGRRRPV